MVAATGQAARAHHQQTSLIMTINKAIILFFEGNFSFDHFEQEAGKKWSEEAVPDEVDNDRLLPGRKQRREQPRPHLGAYSWAPPPDHTHAFPFFGPARPIAVGQTEPIVQAQIS